MYICKDEGANCSIFAKNLSKFKPDEKTTFYVYIFRRVLSLVANREVDDYGSAHAVDWLLYVVLILVDWAIAQRSNVGIMRDEDMTLNWQDAAMCSTENQAASQSDSCRAAFMRSSPRNSETA
jgi:hypothetical protein